MAPKLASSKDAMSEDELELEEEPEEEEALVAYEIASYPSDLTLWGIRDMWKQGDIVIPEFQRNFVWSITQASLLIESFLIGLPVPQVFFYIDDESKNLVIDGQQRIVSTVFFFDGYFGEEGTHGKRQVFRLTGLDDRSPFAGKRFEDLSDALQRKLKGSVLRAINIRQLSPKRENTSIYHIFERLNTGGTPLKAQEIRNCVFRGGFIPILRDLNKNADWRKILGKKTFDKHQKDIELLLRVFALSDGGWQTYVKPMKEYLNVAMNMNKEGDSKRVKRFQSTFPKAAALIVKQLGPKPFHIRGPLNSSALDAVMCTVIDNLAAVPDDLDKRFAALRKHDAFVNATYYGTSDTTVLQKRFEEAKAILID
jgi:hypothetical protein